MTQPTILGVDAATLQTFDAAYNAWLPPAVAALSTMDPSQGARQAQAATLAAQGYFIDVPINVWGWDPYLTMLQRQIDGYATYPDALDAQTKKVSTNPADYPPYQAPAPPSGTVLVGAQIPFMPYFYPTAACVALNLPAGFTTEENGHTYVLQLIVQQSPIPGAGSQVIDRWLQTA